jgi:hypothetical protein
MFFEESVVKTSREEVKQGSEVVPNKKQEARGPMP